MGCNLCHNLLSQHACTICLTFMHNNMSNLEIVCVEMRSKKGLVGEYFLKKKFPNIMGLSYVHESPNIMGLSYVLSIMGLSYV